MNIFLFLALLLTSLPSVVTKLAKSKGYRQVTWEEMNQGKIIEYINQGRFICALCLQDKGTRLHLLMHSNLEVSLSPKRAILISRSSIETLSPR